MHPQPDGPLKTGMCKCFRAEKSRGRRITISWSIWLMLFAEFYRVMTRDARVALGLRE